MEGSRGKSHVVGLSYFRDTGHHGHHFPLILDLIQIPFLSLVKKVYTQILQLLLITELPPPPPKKLW